MITALSALLIVLGALQWRWQSQISENDREKMHKRAQADTSRFAEDFNKEIQNAYFNFEIEADDFRAANYRPFLERYNFWHEKSAYPDLIDDFYFFDAAGQNAPLKYDKGSNIFSAVEWSPELRDIFARASDEKGFRPVYEDIYTLALPEYERPAKMQEVMIRRSAEPTQPPVGNPERQRAEMPKKFGYLAIRLDPQVIKNNLLPDLASKYFGDGDFRLAVTGKDNETVFQTAGTVGASDAQAGLFELSPNDMFFFANRDLVNSIGGRHENVVMNHVESRTMSRTEVNKGSAGTVKIEVQRGQGPKTEIFTTKTDGPGPLWTLSAQHTAGSIDAYIANAKSRNLGVGFGILALLGLSVAAIIFSAQRAKTFARRQVDFVSSVSHEFRTPLAVIYSAGENLADGVTKNDRQVTNYGELIKGEGRKLSSMVEQILEFAGANSGRRNYSFREISVADVVNDAIAECRPQIEHRGITLETDIEPLLPVISADGDALSRAIRNLIANSIKYSNGSNWIRITAGNGVSAIRISVEDRGLGIAKNDMGKIFEPFFRSREVVDAQIAGNGLGLSLVKQIVESHGGRVTAESEIGKGSKFTIELPFS